MWLHHMTESSPIDNPPQERKFIQDYEENYSGTRSQYVPYSTTRPKIESWQPAKNTDWPVAIMLCIQLAVVWVALLLTIIGIQACN